ncbi:hypothetical protein CLV62_11681 [Dysgonomonas alginatilytica]|uniref:DUF6377 domain-containing protein n=1 Tax=Dysgonomonas alginatilytica TaxID=1605892 RepID=A0A2V3PMD7_9BACT|nr:DUF6377 domain-containing protein [Dysgonomonas alginatilytica]PXV63040.1 hypothetical protein CLV62_11681 [Dysgonomonas alginatilytica]
MKKIFVLLALILWGISSLYAENELDSLLRALDNKIKHDQTYIEIKENRIKGLKKDKQQSGLSMKDIYSLNILLYKEYRSYMSDSALCYLNKNLDISYLLNDTYKINETNISISRLCASLGMYCEAFDAIAKVSKNELDRNQTAAYYISYKNIYGGLALYTQNKRSKGEYWKQHKTYVDTLLQILDRKSPEYLNLEETILRERGLIDKALKVNDQRLNLTQAGKGEYALATFHRSLLYQKKQDIINQKKYLCRSAISDVQSVIKDNAAISMLANILFEEGNINRAYDYIRFSLSNANTYNTRLRASEILNVQTIIDQAYHEKSKHQKDKLELYLIYISVLSVLLFILILFIYKQMKRVERMSIHVEKSNTQLKDLNITLQNVNEQLQRTNMEVVEANKIKEEYISYFLHQCSEYIDKIDDYRKMVNRKIKDREIDELYKITKNNNLKEQELKELFRNFDTMFLHLFPDFIVEFNLLLQPEEQIILKNGELNTELRIFALIRLGISDSSQIANFLDYSVNTIYNYRAKVKNKTKTYRSDFENQVRKIGTFSR